MAGFWKSIRKMKKSFLSAVMSALMAGTLIFGGQGTIYVHAEKAAPAYEFANVKADESEYDAFVRLGTTFYNSYIKDKYQSTAAIKGGSEKVFTQESVYAMEYAINKDFLKDETVEKLTSGSTKLVDLDSYAEILNAFCAESCAAMAEARRSTDAPDNRYNDISGWDDSQEWRTEDTVAKGITTPDFSKLSFFGFDPLGSSTVFEYLYHYANIGRGAIRDVTKENVSIYKSNNRLLNKDGNLIMGWGRLENGDIAAQSGYTFGVSDLTLFYNNTGYALVASDNRYYLMYNDVLQTGNTTLNFVNDMALSGLPWYEMEKLDDKDVVITPDKYYGMNDEDFANVIGLKNNTYINRQESVCYQKIFNMLDFSLPIDEAGEGDEIHTLQRESDEVVLVNQLESVKLKVSVGNDIDNWYQEHVRYISSNPDVAYVDQGGTVYGITAGTATVTAFVKSAGRCRPVQFTIQVKGTPNIKTNIPVGYFVEDSIFLGDCADTLFDSLPENVEADGGAAVALYEQPMFYVNGSIPEDGTAAVGEEDVLTLDRQTERASLGTIPFEDYKKLADQLHAKGKKLYIFYQTYYSWDFGVSCSEDGYINKMAKKYSENPSDEEAARLVSKLMDAYEGYITKYGPYYDKAGVDGIYVTEGLGSFNNCLFSIPGERWEQLLNNVRKVYHGELLAYATQTDASRSLVLNSEGLLSNVDGIHVNMNIWNFENNFSKPNPSVEECKAVIQEKYATFCDLLYEKYHKPISTEWWIGSTATPTTNIIYACGKGICGDPQFSSFTTNADYLQQMVVWEALMELFSEKPYTDIIYSRYLCKNWRVWNMGMDLQSGYDVTATVYKKPAAKLLKAWSTKTLDRVLGADADFSVTSVGENELIAGSVAMNKGETGVIHVSKTGLSLAYKSKDTDVVTVDADGMLTTKAPGKAMVEVMDSSNKTKVSLAVYVLPDSELGREMLAKVKTFVEALLSNDYKQSDDMLWKAYELAVRINEPLLGTAFVDELVDANMFALSSNRQYSAFVESLKNYNTVSIDSLRLTSNTGTDCATNAEYIVKYIAKDPYDSNRNLNCDRVDLETDPAQWEIRHKEGDTAYGWGQDGDNWCAQAMIDVTAEEQPMFTGNGIITGDRIYFVDWRLLHEKTLKDGQIELALEEDGGISLSDFREQVGDATYDTLMSACTGYNDAQWVNELSCGFVKSDIGYPTDSVFDFSCEDVEYDGTTPLFPQVTKNYSKGEVSFTYKNRDGGDWTSTAPKEAGNYIVKGAVAANNGYRKHVVEKAVKITSQATTPSKPELTAPQNVEVEEQEGVVVISWSKADAARRYKVVKRCSSEDEWQLVGYTSKLTMEDAVTACEQDIDYAVYSLDYLETSQISDIAHIKTGDHAAGEIENRVEPTCTEAGQTGDAICEKCGEILVPSEVIEPLGHDWSAPRYEWGEAYDSCRVTRTCKHNEEHVETADAEISLTVTEPDSTKEGVKTYTAVFSVDWAEDQIKTESIPATGKEEESGSKEEEEEEEKDKDNDKNKDEETTEAEDTSKPSQSEPTDDSKKPSQSEPTDDSKKPSQPESADDSKKPSQSKPTDAQKPEQSQPTDTQKPGQPEATEQPAVEYKEGTDFNKGNDSYEVVSVDSNKGTVAYTGTASKNKKSITVPKTVTVEGKTFVVTEIADNAFKSNTKVISITVSANITKIGKNSFSGCKNLKKITIKSTTLKKVGKNAFKGIHKKAVIKVPKKQLAKYKKLFKGKGLPKTVKIK